MDLCSYVRQFNKFLQAVAALLPGERCVQSGNKLAQLLDGFYVEVRAKFSFVLFIWRTFLMTSKCNSSEKDKGV